MFATSAVLAATVRLAAARRAMVVDEPETKRPRVATDQAEQAAPGKIRMPKAVVDKVKWTNANIELIEPIRLGGIARPLSEIGDWQVALKLLEQLSTDVADRDPNVWIKEQAKKHKHAEPALKRAAGNDPDNAPASRDDRKECGEEETGDAPDDAFEDLASGANWRQELGQSAESSSEAPVMAMELPSSWSAAKKLRHGVVTPAAEAEAAAQKQPKGLFEPPVLRKDLDFDQQMVQAKVQWLNKEGIWPGAHPLDEAALFYVLSIPPSRALEILEEVETVGADIDTDGPSAYVRKVVDKHRVFLCIPPLL